MKHTHTPGPWAIEVDPHDPSCLNVTSETLPYVAAVFGDSSTPTLQQCFNARLIAAAPLLLVALRDLVACTAHTYDNRHEVNAALDAIESATGGQV